LDGTPAALPHAERARPRAVWTEAVKPLGPIAYIIRARVVLLRDIGACMSPFNAFQFIQGLETLPLRMREHCRNAAEVAVYPQRHPEVARVIYPGLHEDAEQRRRANAYLRDRLTSSRYSQPTKIRRI
jgi:O-acetylhomoserine (thiol)-lyase